MFRHRLHSLACPVLNRPTPQGLSGRWRHASEWACLARAAGLAAPGFRHTGRDPTDAGYLSLAPPGTNPVRVVVLEGEVFGAELPEPVRGSCARFAALAETALLGIAGSCPASPCG